MIMKILLMTLSAAGLALTIVPAILVYAQVITLETHKTLMGAGLLLWFFTAPLWIKTKN